MLSFFAPGSFLLILVSLLTAAAALRAIRTRQIVVDVAQRLGLSWRSTVPMSIGEAHGIVEGFPIVVHRFPPSLATGGMSGLTVDLVTNPGLPFDGQIRPFDRAVRIRRWIAEQTRNLDSTGASSFARWLRQISAAEFGADPDARYAEVDIEKRLTARVSDPEAFETQFDDDAVYQLIQLLDRVDDMVIVPSRIRLYVFGGRVGADAVVDATRTAVGFADGFRRRRVRQVAARARMRTPTRPPT